MTKTRLGSDGSVSDRNMNSLEERDYKSKKLQTTVSTRIKDTSLTHSPQQVTTGPMMEKKKRISGRKSKVKRKTKRTTRLPVPSRRKNPKTTAEEMRRKKQTTLSRSVHFTKLRKKIGEAAVCLIMKDWSLCHTITCVEGGNVGWYEVVLSERPESDVIVTIEDDSDLVETVPNRIKFNRQNYHTPQIVRVVARDNDVDSKGVAKKTRLLHRCKSLDARYAGSGVTVRPEAITVMVVDNDGTFTWSFGDGEYGELGTQNRGISTVPKFVSIPINKGVDKIARTPKKKQRMSIQVRLGAETDEKDPVLDAEDRLVANQPASLRVSALGAGKNFSVVSTGELYSFGRNNHGQLGLGNFTDTVIPHDWDHSDASGRPHPAVEMVSCGESHMVFVTDAGTLLACGLGDFGQLGVEGLRALPEKERKIGCPIPRVVKVGSPVVGVACGDRHTACITNDYNMFVWGDGRSGALGIGPLPRNEQIVWLPRLVNAMVDRSPFMVSCGDIHTCVIDGKGNLHSAGFPAHGRLGRKGAEDWFGLVQHSTMVTEVSCGGNYTLFVDNMNRAYAFGGNQSGQLGLGDCVSRHRPEHVRLLMACDPCDSSSFALFSLSLPLPLILSFSLPLSLSLSLSLCSPSSFSFVLHLIPTYHDSVLS